MSTDKDSGVSLVSTVARDVIEELVVRSALDVLAASGQEFHAEGAAEALDLDLSKAEAPSFLANIGFAGDQIRGSFVLVAGARVMQAVLPADLPVTATMDLVMRDQLGELANLMLGRIKNHLLKRGVAIMLATPTTTSGRELQVSSAAQASEWHVMSCREGPLYVRLEADLSACGELTEESSTEAESPMDEGEMLLF